MAIIYEICQKLFLLQSGVERLKSFEISFWMPWITIVYTNKIESDFAKNYVV